MANASRLPASRPFRLTNQAMFGQHQEVAAQQQSRQDDASGAHQQVRVPLNSLHTRHPTASLALIPLAAVHSCSPQIRPCSPPVWPLRSTTELDISCGQWHVIATCRTRHLCCSVTHRKPRSRKLVADYHRQGDDLLRPVGRPLDVGSDALNAAEAAASAMAASAAGGFARR